MDKYTKTRFNRAPTISKGRTRFDLSHPILKTFNTGEFVPIFVEPVYPGETHSLRYASLTRLETSLHQTMDNAYIEFAFFFVPLRLVWTNFEKYLGANDDAWTQSNSYTIPQLRYTGSSSGEVVQPGSLLNQLMAPADTYGSGTSNPYIETEALSLRSVFQVYNDWYRDENYDSIVYFDKGDTDRNIGAGFLFNGSNIYITQNGSGYALKVNRLHDIFSSALPAPQRADAVTLPLGTSAPIVTSTNIHDMGTEHLWLAEGATSAEATTGHFGGATGTGMHGYVVKKAFTGSTGEAQTDYVKYTNMEADLSDATSVTVNQLRLAILAQVIAERDARAGTRYKEKVYGEWGVTVPDLEIDRSEFLGGKRIPVSMMEVLQTSETGTTVLGTDAGHSKTFDSSEGFIRSFTQYGFILGFAYVRTARSYSQGIDRKHFIKGKWDLYDPMMDNIGELPVYKKELYCLGTSTPGNVTKANSVWGYQEAWYWLKERTPRYSGYFQPGISGTLSSWHYGDSYSDYPQMSAHWLKESPDQVDRTIAVSSEAAFQWSLNMEFTYYVTRIASKFSIPNTFGF